jgi:B9 domain-containing protein 1
VDLTFKSTNVHGWPSIVLCIYGLDELGRDVVRGYGVQRLPRTQGKSSGKSSLFVPLFTPVATSPLNGFLSWIMGRYPEFLDPKFIAKSYGRQVTRVSSSGSAKLRINISSKDLDKFGFKF